MTTIELRNYFNNEFSKNGIETSLPKTYEVDAETYGNVCNLIINKTAEHIELFMDWEKLELKENTTWEGFERRLSITIGKHNGIMFKGVELILKNENIQPK